jgi:hypothetical protein
LPGGVQKRHKGAGFAVRWRNFYAGPTHFTPDRHRHEEFDAVFPHGRVESPAVGLESKPNELAGPRSNSELPVKGRHGERCRTDA